MAIFRVHYPRFFIGGLGEQEHAESSACCIGDLCELGQPVLVIQRAQVSADSVSCHLHKQSTVISLRSINQVGKIFLKFKVKVSLRKRTGKIPRKLFLQDILILNLLLTLTKDSGSQV